MLGLKLVAGSHADLADVARSRGIRVEEASERLLTKLAGTDNHQGLVATCSPVANGGWRAAMAGVAAPLVLVLDQVQDPRNLGSCLRTAAAMGVQALLHPQRHSAGLTPLARQVAAGAEEYVAVDPVVNVVRELRAMKDMGFTVVGADVREGTDPAKLEESGPVALVLGGEAKGMRRLTRASCDVLVRIPLPGGDRIGSLNVAVACGICLAAVVGGRSLPR